MGVLSMDELLLVLGLLPFAIGVDAFLGVDEPNPTGVCLREESLPPPDLMLEDLENISFWDYLIHLTTLNLMSIKASNG